MPRDPAKRRASNQRYEQSAKGQAALQRYNQSDKGQARKQRREDKLAAFHFKSGRLDQQGTFKGVWLNAERTEWALEKEQQ
jgi:hypothetical protein